MLVGKLLFAPEKGEDMRSRIAEAIRKRLNTYKKRSNTIKIIITIGSTPALIIWA